MPQTVTVQVTLSDEELWLIQKSVAVGEFSSEGEILTTGLHYLLGELQERRQWEQDVILPTLARLAENPASTLSITEVEERLERRRRQRLATS